jgi:hypothetical protein
MPLPKKMLQVIETLVDKEDAFSANHCTEFYKNPLGEFYT